jgi:hypothetical protein
LQIQYCIAAYTQGLLLRAVRFGVTGRFVVKGIPSGHRRLGGWRQTAFMNMGSATTLRSASPVGEASNYPQKLPGVDSNWNGLKRMTSGPSSPTRCEKPSVISDLDGWLSFVGDYRTFLTHRVADTAELFGSVSAV